MDQVIDHPSQYTFMRSSRCPRLNRENAGSSALVPQPDSFIFLSLDFDIASYPLDEQGREITPSTKSLLESDEPGIGDTARFVCHVLIEFGDSVAQQPSSAAQFRLAAEKKLNMSFSRKW